MNMNNDVQKIALITGGARGIGRAIVDLFQEPLTLVQQAETMLRLSQSLQNHNH